MASTNEISVIQERFILYYAEQVKEIASKLHGPYQQLWSNWLEEEIDNLRTCLKWCLENKRGEIGLRITADLYDFWLRRGYLSEGLTWSTRMLAVGKEDNEPLLYARVYSTIAHFSWLLGDYETADKAALTSIELAEKSGEKGKIYLATFLMGRSSGIRTAGDFKGAFELCDQSIRMLRELGETSRLIPALLLQGVNATILGEFKVARDLIDEGLSMATALQNKHMVGMGLKFLGDLAFCENDYVFAESVYKQSMEQYLELGQTSDVGGIQCALGNAYLRQDELSKAVDVFQKSLGLQQSTINQRGIAECILGIGALAQTREMHKYAVQLLTAGVDLGGRGILYSNPVQRQVYKHSFEMAKLALDRGDFFDAQQKGQETTLEEATALASIVLREAFDKKQPDKGYMRGLTPRQQEVAMLIAKGKTNGEIADILVISKRTVEKHVANILAQLEFTNRAEIIQWGIEHRLI
jgi:non-specific serine/threonine protein kinase